MQNGKSFRRQFWRIDFSKKKLFIFSFFALCFALRSLVRSQHAIDSIELEWKINY